MFFQLLALGEEYENTEEALVHSGNSLSGATRLINLLIKYVEYSLILIEEYLVI